MPSSMMLMVLLCLVGMIVAQEVTENDTVPAIIGCETNSTEISENCTKEDANLTTEIMNITETATEVANIEIEITEVIIDSMNTTVGTNDSMNTVTETEESIINAETTEPATTVAVVVEETTLNATSNEDDHETDVEVDEGDSEDEDTENDDDDANNSTESQTEITTNTTCSLNEEYKICGNPCEPTCPVFHRKRPFCREDCKPGCFCKNGLVRDKDKNCIHPINCTLTIIS